MPKAKILIVDDDQGSLSMFSLFLDAYGYPVITAANGPEALALIATEHPSIVFTDIKMPGMDGLELLGRIKQIAPETEVIVVTGHGDMDLAVDALDRAATDFINKPLQREALEAALDRAETRLKTPPPQKSTVTRHNREGISVLEITGDLTIDTANQLTEAYDAKSRQGFQRIIIHFDSVASTNRSGIAALITLLAKASNQGRHLAITGLPENFKAIFDLTGVTRYAKLVDSFASAQAYFETTT